MHGCTNMLKAYVEELHISDQMDISYQMDIELEAFKRAFVTHWNEENVKNE